MKVEKPWGHFKQYAQNKTCSVKLITVEPKEQTSLHWHNLRSDMWVVLDSGLQVQIGDQVHDAEAGEEFFIPSEQAHRIMSTGERGRVLEIAFGYCVEEDNHRIADDYGRAIGE